jgi:tetratricopeptide (TPR) repeat protein
MDMGMVQERLGHFNDALDSEQKSLAAFVKLGDSDGEAKAQANLGIVERDLNRYADARDAFTKALALRLKLNGDPAETADDFVNVVDTDILTKMFDAALADAKRGAAFAPGNLALTLKLAHAQLYGGDVAGATSIYLKHASERIGKGTFIDAALGDFARYRAAGVDSPGVAAVEAALKGAGRSP